MKQMTPTVAQWRYANSGGDIVALGLAPATIALTRPCSPPPPPHPPLFQSGQYLLIGHNTVLKTSLTNVE